MNNILMTLLSKIACAQSAYHIMYGITAVLCAIEVVHTGIVLRAIAKARALRGNRYIGNALTASSVVFVMLMVASAIYALSTREPPQMNALDVLYIVPILVYIYSMRIIKRELLVFTGIAKRKPTGSVTNG